MAAPTPDAAAVEKLVSLIESGQFHKIVVCVGAGISVAAGIPDFRSPSIGLYASVSSMAHLKFHSPTFVFDLGAFRRDPRPFWWIVSRLWPRGDFPKPTAFHHFITLLHRRGLLLRCFSQNIDALEEMSGLPPEKVVYAHGVLSPCHCLSCRREIPLAYCIDAIRRNDPEAGHWDHTEVPVCPGCASRFVKPDVVFFGERMPENFFRRMDVDLPECDLLIVAGTSLQVWPFAMVPNEVPAGVPRFLVNREKVRERGGFWKGAWNKIKSAATFGLCDFSGVFDFESERDWFVGGDLQDAAVQVIERLGWSDDLRASREEADAREHVFNVRAGDQ
jgi:NAD-dependent SIR2 family protein deacetylase